jgi:formiminotetrahydrofolate cyclodeaminase
MSQQNLEDEITAAGGNPVELLRGSTQGAYAPPSRSEANVGGGKPTSEQGISTVTVGAFVDAVASGEPVPGGGAVCGAVAALAAALAGMAGRYALRRDPDSTFGELVQQLDDLRERALGLADDDATAYNRYVAASSLSKVPDPEPRRVAVRAALDAAADVPAELAGLAVDIAAAGEDLAVSGNPNLRSDACTATLLAAAVAGSAAILVNENLRAHPDDPRVSAARAHAAQAAAGALRVAPADSSGDRITP